MAPAVGRFAPQNIQPPFSHINQHVHQNSHLQQHSNAAAAAGLPNQPMNSHYPQVGSQMYLQSTNSNLNGNGHHIVAAAAAAAAAAGVQNSMVGNGSVSRNYGHSVGLQHQHLQHPQHQHPQHHQAQHPTHHPQPHHQQQTTQQQRQQQQQLQHSISHQQAAHAQSLSHIQQHQQLQQLHALQSVQQHQSQQQSGPLDSSLLQSSMIKSSHGRTREVWKDNLLQEMHLLRYLIERYPYISMDTEFPGVVARPMGDFASKASYHYQTLRCNVDLLKLIQLGITLFSVDGDLPPLQLEESGLSQVPNLAVCPCTWTFNFKFSVDDDMFNQDSIDMLRKAGAHFDKHAEMGIDPAEFGSLLITSGLVLSDDVHWISFHSGYDFAYLVKLMWCKQLPDDEDEYRRIATIFFPNLYDVKFMLRHIQRTVARNSVHTSDAIRMVTNLGSKSALQDLADELGCQRVGAQHTAGSDAWLTGLVFWQMKAKMFGDHIPDELNGQIWGITSVGAPAASSTFSHLLMSGQLPVLASSNGTGVRGHGQDGEGPSTPPSSSIGLASTTPGPSHPHTGSNGMGTPNAFGNFQYGK